MSLRNAVSLCAHQKQIANKFFQKVSMILTASDCTCKHFLNTMTFILLFFMRSITGKSNPWQSIYCKSRIEKSDWRKKPLLFQHFKHGAGCLHPAWKLRDLALGTLPGTSISRAWRGVSQWLVNPQAAAASGLSWQPQGYGHGLWMLAHTAWLLGLWLIPYHQLTLALCQCFFQFRKHGK